MVRTNFMMAPFTPIIGREKNQKWELDFYDGTYYNYDNKIIEHRGVDVLDENAGVRTTQRWNEYAMKMEDIY